MTIICDSREHAHAIKSILATFDKQGVKWHISKLVVGDYMSLDNARLCIDRKQSLGELVSNVCQQHDRFKAELQRANDLGIKLIVLCEHGQGIKTLSDVAGWTNPRTKLHPTAMSGDRLFKVLTTMSVRYGVEFLFCAKHSTGKRIIDILEAGNGLI
jgi:ERCC4-type nuclease